MSERRTYTAKEIRLIAETNELGPVHFEDRIALNTGAAFKAAYVGERKNRSLFAKATRSTDFEYYLCNEFEGLVNRSGT